ncbi:MAG: hypothetical protein OES34_09750 [Nitrosopumilus sp.]|nr:hypothetical protein [Nitrosopumilus sp.]
MTLPDTVLVRRADVRAYLGVSDYHIAAMIIAGTLTQVHVTPGGRALYRRDDVIKIGEGLLPKNEREESYEIGIE